MNIEVWSDFFCPYCYIGKRRLDNALKQFPHADQIAFQFKSFQLNPQVPVNTDLTHNEDLAERYNMPIEQVVRELGKIADTAREVGLDFRFETMIPTNSFDAHRLMQWGMKQGKGKELNERLFHASFTECLHLGDRAQLADLAEEVGLDRAEAVKVLEEGLFADAVRQDERDARQIGVRGVPYFVFDRKLAVSGAQSEHVFLQVLEQAWGQRNPLKILGDPDVEACGEDGCAL